MKNSKRAHRILAWLLTMTLIFTMSFSSIAYAAETDTAGETEGTNTEATTMDTSEEQTSDPAEDTAKASQEAEQEETQNPEALGESTTPAPSIDEKDVAAIGNQGYGTLAAAVEAARNTETTIKLLKNVENIATLRIEEGQNVTLDLNGKSISSDIRSDNNSKHYYAIDNYGTLTINDSSEAGTGTITARGIENLGKGHMTINGGRIIACDSNGGASIWNEADLTVNGGTFETTHVGTSSDLYGAGCLNNSGVTRIKGGVFTSVNKRTYAIISTGEIEITPAEGKTVEVTGAHGGLGVDSGTAVINGGTYNSSEYYGLYVSNDGEGRDPELATVTVNGGFFDGANYSVWIGSDYNNPVNSTIEINGGEFKKPLNAQDCTRDGAIVVTGGTFSTDPSKFVAAGYIATKQSNGTWTVAETPKVAEIGDKKYASLEDAVADVPKNGTKTTIKLIGDVEVEKHVAINSGKNIVLDLNGFDVTSNSYYVFNVGNAKFSITGKGAIIENIEDGYAPIIARGSGENESNYTVITVDEDVTLKGDYSGIFIAKDMAGGYKNYGLVINIKGTIDVSDVGPNNYCGIYINGQNTNTEGNVVAIDLEGAKIIGAKTGIYAAGYGEWNIKNSEIAAENSAMEIRAGKVVIDGGKYSASKVPTATTPNGNGSTTEGAGIAVAQHTTELPIDVTVKGGTIEGFTGLLVTNPEENKNAGKVKVTVEGGNFKAIKDGTNSIAKADTAAEMTLLVNGGYFSDNSADNYLAANKALIPSDKDGYKYMVSAKKSDVVVSTPAEGENTIEVPATGVDNNEVIETLKNIDVDLDAAARTLASEQGVTKEDAKKALKEAKIDVPENAEVVVQVETFLKISVEQYPNENNDKYVLDIEPMYQLVAKVDGKSETAIIGEAEPLKISHEVEVTIPIPDNFLIGNPEYITIKHTKDDNKVYYYSAKVETKGGKTFATFTNPNGFSSFQLMQQSDNVNIDTVALNYTEGSEAKSIDTTIEADKLEYTAKFDAVKKAPDVVKVKVTSTGTDKNAKVKVLLGGIESKEKNVDLGLGTTTFNVLVLAEDDTAVLYTFNVTRCERVENVTLNKDTFTYNGKAQAPAVTVKTADGTTLKNGDAYTVSYKGNRTSVGTHTVTVLCKDKYEGEISKNYTINPAKPAIKKIKSSKRKMKVYMTTKPGSKGAKYYKISYRQKGTSTWKSTTTSSSYKTIKGLKKGKRYYVKVYAYTGSYKSVYSTTKLSKKIR